MNQNSLPFKVGQLAESRSFEKGFRGAWFRCKIKKIASKNGHIMHALEYIDYPDEKIEWVQLYQTPKSRGRPNLTKRQLMVRPAFPPVTREHDLPDASKISELTVVVNDVWRVGDVVDWWTDGCFWAGKITKILGEGKVQILFPPPPFGEGQCYDAFCKDLRPSLDWSLEIGWAVPTSEGPENWGQCARLLQPDSLELQVAQSNVGSSTRADASISSEIPCSLTRANQSEQCLADETPKKPPSANGSGETKEATDIPKTIVDLDMANSGLGTSFSDILPSSHIRDASLETTSTKGDNEKNIESLKKMRTGETNPRDLICADSLEASVRDLEDLSNKIKWLKGILNFGNPKLLRPPWKFMEDRPSAVEE